jgi:ATP-dependent exoDNAse (exonuclease V) beta subunit
MLPEPEARALWDRALESLWADDCPEELIQAMDRLLVRETRPSLLSLFTRVKGLASFGALSRLLESSSPDEVALGQAARYALDRYARLKQRRGALDFDDLERAADRALEVDSVREALSRRFDLVLVDEFQDTNPVQARVVWRLVRPEATNLVVVGDPKQSIYRFRDADVTVFEEFCTKLPERHSLTRNFRSRPGIIDFVNGVCEEVFPPSGLAFEPLVPEREAGEVSSPVSRLDVKSPEDLTRWIRAEEARGTRLEEMALLLRKIRGNERWLRALVAAGIPIAVGSGGLFWEDPRVREVVEFLRWWDNPGNSLAGATFLRSPWVGIADLEIDAWVKRDPTLAGPFFGSGHPLAEALKPYRGLPVRPGELILAALADETREAELGAAALGLWHRAEEFSSRGMSFDQVTSEFSRAVKEGRRERDVPPPLNQGQLPVLTLHGSKGLEFAHVILIDFGKKPRASETPLLFWDRKEGVHLGARTEDGARDRKSHIETLWREEERRKEIAESKRLFYVALTRARERLLLVCPALEEKDSARINPETAFAEDHWRAWIECARTKPDGMALPHADDLTAVRRPVESAERERLAPVPLHRWVRPRHSVTEWNLLSKCPRAYEWTHIRPKQVEEAAPFVPSEGPRAARITSGELGHRELGTRVHACLELADYDGLERLEQEVGGERFHARGLIDWAKASDWMTGERPGRRVWTELEFEVPIGEKSPEILVGAIDRLICEGEPGEGARYRILDFKISSHLRSARELREAYGTQLDLYAAAVRALDPSAHEIRASLLEITPQGVREVAVPLEEAVAGRLALSSATIVAGESGSARPGLGCARCDFRGVCDQSSTRN